MHRVSVQLAKPKPNPRGGAPAAAAGPANPYRLSPDGASVIVRVGNPLSLDLLGLSDAQRAMHAAQGPAEPSFVDSSFMDKIVATASAAAPADAARLGALRFDEHQYPRGGKRTLHHLLQPSVGAPADPRGGGGGGEDGKTMLEDFLQVSYRSVAFSGTIGEESLFLTPTRWPLQHVNAKFREATNIPPDPW